MLCPFPVAHSDTSQRPADRAEQRIRRRGVARFVHGRVARGLVRESIERAEPVGDRLEEIWSYAVSDVDAFFTR